MLQGIFEHKNIQNTWKTALPYQHNQLQTATAQIFQVFSQIGM